MKNRIYFLDHLRTFAIFLVVVVHAGLVYEWTLDSMWIVSDPVKNNNIGLIRMYLDLIVMFTIFFVSGYFIPLSVKKKNTLDFLKSKFKRILWPWLLAVFTLIPAYKFIYLYSRGLPQEEWYSYFHLFQRADSDLWLFSNDPNQNWLWFLPILFTFQLIYLGLSKVKISWPKLTVRTGVILTIVIGVVYGMIISGAGLTGWYHSGFLEFQRERLLPYFMVFLLGALCQKEKVFEAPKNMKLYIWANVVLTFALGIFTAVALNLFFNLIEPGRNYFFVSDFVDRGVYYLTALLSMFSFLYVLIHVFRFNLNKTGPLMNELNRNSYGVYIIHLIVLGGIALVMLPWAMPAMLKFLMLTVLTFVLSNLLVSGYRIIVGKSHTRGRVDVTASEMVRG
jgi:peptidoglycan/LPS O-acetylase OafA/YrhL